MSSINVILMPLGLRGQAAERLQGALAVARHFQAHLEVLFTYVSPREMIPDGIFGMSQATLAELIRVADEQAAASASERRELFLQACRQHGVPVSEQPPAGPATSAAWQARSGLRSRLIAERGRLVDLIVVARPPQPRPSAMIYAAVTETGRPVLLMPRAQTTFSADRLVIGWDASAEAARTVDAALAWLKAAQSVTVLTVRDQHVDPPDPDELLAYLGWHGVAATARIVDSANRAIGTVLLGEAQTLNADLLLIGGYGRKHSLRDRLTSRVTQTVLDRTELPVLMAH